MCFLISISSGLPNFMALTGVIPRPEQ